MKNQTETGPDLRYELKELLNKHSRENESNTSDFILADYLMQCLVAFEKAIQKRNLYKSNN